MARPHEGTEQRSSGRLTGRTVALCVTGSVAAYKAAVLARLLVKEGASVVPVMTESATKFIGGATLSGLTGNAALGAAEMWSTPGELHVQLGSTADAVVVAPASADVLARLAQGRADDLVTALVLCAKGPVLVAPAMHPRMWTHPATQKNVEGLRAQGRVMVVGPAVGPVASGDQGPGRMIEPEAILEAIVFAVTPKDLKGVRVVVSAGPTLEDLDPVRFLSNRSSGKMGFAIAARGAARGAEVTLVAGPVQLPTPHGVLRVDVRTALEMQAALAQARASCDAVVMAAAVADYRPAATSGTKIKKKGEQTTLELVQNPDLLAEMGMARTGPRPVLVGFALETGTRQAIVAEARRKLREKKVDVVVANEARTAFGGDDNEITFVTENREERLPRASKVDLADALLDRIKSLLG
ncbi:MAG TPA: bifunctional phosphopantothenoylcysteine decarboxylase/phosphopantothenate--cysteine ligase CoaBC [Polyangiaceae bacterium]|nr:bifunctional phosphopantothenoylcysteine decarboxylase/phosphopantothenate--cysteine ligase CoaBC [Polyangiaceae bacterium]